MELQSIKQNIYTKQYNPKLIQHNQYGINNLPTEHKIISYPNNYYISFGSRLKTIDELYESRYDIGMPSTVSDFLTELKSNDPNVFDYVKNFNSIASIQKFVFSKLADCKTIEDVKKAFPDEKCFQELKSPSEVENGNSCESKFFYQLMQASLRGEKVIDSEDDVTTFIIKKIFLECKSYKDTTKELVNAVIPKDIKEIAKDTYIFENSNAELFKPLGIILPDGIRYGLSLRQGEGKNKTNKSSLANLSPTEINDKIKNLLNDKEKWQFIMMDAWNNCFDIRQSLSQFMYENNENPLYNQSVFDGYGDIVDIYNFINKKNEYAIRMSKLMIDFWSKYPEYKKQFSFAVQNAENTYETKEAAGNDEFKKYINDVLTKKDTAKKLIQKLRIGYNKPYSKAKEILRKLLSEKIKPFFINDENSINEAVKLLIKNSFDENELKIIEGDITPEFKQLVMGNQGNCVLNKIKDLMNSNPEYRCIINSQLLAILNNIVSDKNQNSENIPSIIRDRKAFTDLVKKSVKNPEEYSLNQKQVMNDYNNYKKHLSQEEQNNICDELFRKCKELTNKEKEDISTFLTKQGKYMKNILSDNANVKIPTMVLFGTEFDRKYGTDITSKLLRSADSQIIKEQKTDFIDNQPDWNNLLENIWKSL